MHLSDYANAKLHRGVLSSAVMLFAIYVPASQALAADSFKITWSLDPAKAKKSADGEILLPIPVDQAYQISTFEVTGVRASRTLQCEGNSLLAVMPGDKPFELHVTVTFKLHDFSRTTGRVKSRKVADDVAAFLRRTDVFDPASPLLGAAVQQCKADDPATTVVNFRAWLRKNMQYHFDPGTWRFSSVDELLKRRYAECAGYSVLFVAMCRSASIPARQVWGVCERPAEFRPPGLQPVENQMLSHNWCEVYLAGAGWVPIDPQEPETPLGAIPARRLRICQTNLNYQDCPTTAVALNNMAQMSTYAAATYAIATPVADAAKLKKAKSRRKK